jgi:hypothetical protein
VSEEAAKEEYDVENCRKSDAEWLAARALARWEGEGGALGRAPEDGERLDESELRILPRMEQATVGMRATSACRTPVRWK